MPATVKTTGPATKAIAIVAVVDGVITELINGWTPGAGLTVDPAVTVGSSTYDGNSIAHFETFDNASSMQGIYFDSNPSFSPRTANKGFSAFVAMGGSNWQGSSSASKVVHLQRTGRTQPSNEDGFGVAGSQVPLRASLRIGSFDRAETTVDVPNDGTTPFAVGWNYLNSGTDPGTGYTAGGQVYFALDTDNPAAVAFEPAAPAGGGFQSADVLKLTGVGGQFYPSESTPGTPGDPDPFWAAPGKYLIWAAFDDLLSLAEFQSLHNDPIGALLDVTAPANATVNSQSAVYLDGQIDVTADVSNATGVSAQLKLAGANVGAPVAMTNTAGNTWVAQFGDANGTRLAFATGVQNYTVDLVADPGSVAATATVTPTTMISVSGQPLVNRSL